MDEESRTLALGAGKRSGSTTPRKIHSTATDSTPSNNPPTPSSLGKNRLASGFARQLTSESTNLSEMGSNLQPQTTMQPDDLQKTRKDHEAIVISDDEEDDDNDEDEDMEESEGGMVINLEGQEIPTKTYEYSEGEISSGQNDIDTPISEQNVAHIHSQGGQNHGRNPDLPSQPRVLKRLVDLSTKELEDQLRYAFYHLDRDQIDLHRPTICLTCFAEGHMSPDCSENNCTRCGSTSKHSTRKCSKTQRCSKCRERGHNSTSCKSDFKNTTIPCDICKGLGHVEDSCPHQFFPPFQKPEKQVNLWISCCVCASKSHLVGDCPAAPHANIQRWSLRGLDPGQIINMSLETGTRGLEREAETRGLRPEGLRIKGSAALHQRGGPQAGSRMDMSSDEPDDEPFLKHRAIQSHTGPSNPIRIGRFDRFEPSSSQNNRRPPPPSSDRARDRDNDRERDRRRGDQWHSTDSFGRPISRQYSSSPPPPSRSRSPVRRSGPGGRERDNHGPVRTNTWTHLNRPGERFTYQTTGADRGSGGGNAGRRQNNPFPVVGTATGPTGSKSNSNSHPNSAASSTKGGGSGGNFKKRKSKPSHSGRK